MIKFCNKCQLKEDWENFTQLQKTFLLPSNFVTIATIESSMKLQTQLANMSTDAEMQVWPSGGEILQTLNSNVQLSGWEDNFKKHLKNCERCPVSQSIVR